MISKEKALSITEKWVNKIFDTKQGVIDTLNKKAIDTEKVTRVEVIDEKGRSYVNWKANNNVKVSIQDDGKTMKIFIKQL